MKNYCLIISFLFLALAAMAKENWNINVNSRNNYNGITLANGRIGVVSGADLFSVSEIVLGGVYDKDENLGISKIVRAPLFTNLQLKINNSTIDSSNVTHWEQTLNMKEAYLKTSVLFEETRFSYTLRALRDLPYMTLGIVEITPSEDIQIEAIHRAVFTDEHRQTSSQFHIGRDLEAYMPYFTTLSKSRHGIHHIASASAFMFDGEDIDNEELKLVKGDNQTMHFAKKLKAKATYRFALVGSVCTSRDFADPKNDAERLVVFALRHRIGQLISGHNASWEELWKSDIIIEGCDEDQQDIRLALYNLYSFQRHNSRLSISPMGLSSSNGYGGHIFWDSEIWMYPPILMLHPSLAKAHIDYRSDRLPQAIKRAEMYGYKGAMYPWESDDSGEEGTPAFILTGTFEHHITADIGIAFWNYYRVTKDKEWLRETGYPVMKQIADFWTSRATPNADGSYSIKNVVGADEYAHNVDDNAFTNGAAKIALQNATKAAICLNLVPNKKWNEVADLLCFHYMKDGTTKEHAQYNGEMVKQADVNLLAYPLGLIEDEKTIRKDLHYYENKIDKVNGPAMGNAILSIIHAQLGNEAEAYRLFKKSYVPNKRPPFGALSESASSNNPYFATGAGGLLQAVIFGFAGLELTDEGIVQRRPTLPKTWKSLTLKGIGPDKKDYFIQHQ